MPCLDEVKNIASVISDTLKAFDRYMLNGEIIVVNDGSKDGTKDLVHEVMKNESRVRLINHNAPQGIGASFWDGISNARGDIVSMFPGDNENDPTEILRYCFLLEKTLYM